MGIFDQIQKLLGVIRFHMHTIARKKRIHYVGLKQYLGKSAHIRVSEQGNIKLGENTYISDRSSIGTHVDGQLTIGDNNYFSSNVNVVCFKKITIGNNNLFAQNIVVVDQNHKFHERDIPISKQGFNTKEVIIGSDNWICANVVICPGTEIGDHIVVSANSVVKGKLEKAGVYAGNPAVIVREL